MTESKPLAESHHEYVLRLYKRIDDLTTRLQTAEKLCAEAVDRAFQWENEVRVLREALLLIVELGGFPADIAKQALHQQTERKE